MSPQAQDDPLAGYTPDWRRRLGRPLDGADPLAGYTPDWRTQLADEPMRAAPIRVTTPPAPERPRLTPEQEREHARRREFGREPPGFVESAVDVARAIATGSPGRTPAGVAIPRAIRNTVRDVAMFPVHALRSTVMAPTTPEEARNPYIRARMRALGQDPDTELHEAIRETATGERAGPETGLADLALGLPAMGFHLQRTAQGGPLWEIGEDGKPRLVRDNPDLSDEERIEGITTMAANAALAGLGAGRRAYTEPLGPRLRTGAQNVADATRRAAAGVRERLTPRRPAEPTQPADAAPATDEVTRLRQELDRVEGERRAAVRQAETDPLTGVGNQRAFQRATAKPDPASEIVVFDVNNLKAANDVLGHEFGNQRISQAGEAIARALAEEGVPERVFRTGGDEFVAIAPAGKGAAVRARAEQIYGQAMAGEYPVSLSGSVGRTFAEADAGLQAAKRTRKAGASYRDVNLPPDAIVRMPVREIQADPARFQFKEAGPEGVTAELRNVTRWNPQLAGVVSVWRDPATGLTYVVNGHHRLDLAKRLNVPEINVQFLDAPNATAARAEGAFINMAEGRGTATDVAKFLRDHGATVADLEARGVSVRGDVTRDGLALSRLAPDLFDQVATGKAPQQWGVAIGELLTDPALQREALAAARASGKRLSQAEVREIARQVRDAGTEAVTQETLFGTETERRALFANRAQLAAALKRRLATDRRLFGYVSKEGRADQLGRAGETRIDVDAARGLAEQSALAEEVFDRIYTRTGPIAEAVNEGAKRIAQGERPSAVAADLYPAIGDAVGRELATVARGSGQGGGERPVSPGERAATAEPEAPPAPDSPEGRVADSPDPKQSGLFSPVRRPAAAARPALELRPEAEGPAQQSMFGERAGTAATRSLAEMEAAARSELPRLRDELRLTKDPQRRATLAAQIAQIEKLVNRERAITPGEMATEAAARAPEPTTPTAGPDQIALFSPMHQATSLGAKIRNVVRPPKAQTADVHALIDISRKLAEAVGVPLRQGRFAGAGRTALGVFFPHKEVARTVRFDMLDTVAHEIGHYISKKYLRNPTRRKVRGGGPQSQRLPKGAARELVQMGRDLYGSRKPAGGYGEEGIAEWHKFYVTDPAALAQKAPEFTRYMDGVLRQEPALKGALDQARQDFADYAGSSAERRIDAMISVDERVRFTPDVSWLMKYWLDDLFEIKKDLRELGSSTSPSRDAYVLARLSRGAAGAAEEMLSRGVVRYGTTDVIAPSVEAALRAVPPERIQQLRRYLDAESSLDRWKRGIDPGTAKADAFEVAEKYRQDPVIRKAAEAIWEHYRALIEYRRDAGLLTADEASTILKANPHHVSFYRVFEEFEQPASGGRGGGRGFTRTGSGVLRQKGSARRKLDPLESVFTDTYQTVAQVRKYEVARELIRAAKDTEGGGRIIEEVPAPKRPVSFSIDKIRDQLADLGFAPPGGQSVAEWISQPPMQALLTVFEDVRVARAAEFKDLVIPFREGGEIRWYQIKDRRLYDALQGLGTPQIEGWRRWVSAPVRTLRAGATLTLEFAFGRNPVRDAWGSATFTRAPSFERVKGVPLPRVPGTNLVEGLFHMFKADEVYRTWKLEGGENATMLGLDRVNAQRTLKKLLRTRTMRGKAVEVVRRPLDSLRLLSSIMENATRIGEMAAVRRAELRKGTPLPDANKLGTLAARDISIDFAQGGVAAKELNRLIWTFNASLRGTAQIFREIGGRPKVVVPRALAYVTLPSIALYLLQKDDPEYQDTPAWVRNFAWVWIHRGDDRSSTPDAHNPKGWDGYGSGKVVRRWWFPRPFALGVVFGTVPERITEWLGKKKPASLRHMRDALIQAFVPPVVPTGITPLIENYANESMHRDRPIVPRGREDLPAAEQFTRGTSETARLLGRALDYPPAKIDNLIRGYTAGLGQYASRGADAALRLAMGEAKPEDVSDPFAHIPLIRAFVLRGGGMSSEAVEEFYRAFERAEGHRRVWRGHLDAGRTDEARAYLARHRDAIRSVATEEEAGVPGPLRILHNEIRRLQELRRDLGERGQAMRSHQIAGEIRERVRRRMP